MFDPFDQSVCAWSEGLSLIRVFVFAFDQSVCVWSVWSECLCLMRGASPPLFQLSPPAVVGQWVSRSQLGNTWPSPFLVCCVCVCVFVFVFMFVLIHFICKGQWGSACWEHLAQLFFLPYSLHWYRNTHIYISERWNIILIWSLIALPEPVSTSLLVQIGHVRICRRANVSQKS